MAEIIANPHIEQVISSIQKSESDLRQYRALILKNQMMVLLISDPKTFKAAASLAVAAGSLSDPVELPGLAHFCEHMLFMGTSKYPDENDFDKFVSEHGGCTNAFTFEDSTNYHFDIAPDALEASLDRFAQFFIDPLFTESATEREVQAVNSEHEQNIPDDDWRQTQIIKEVSDPSHPYAKFGTGNLTTLWTKPRAQNIDIRQELLSYHQKYYSANMMTLAVLGIESLDELTNIVTKLFIHVENKNVAIPKWTTSPFGSSQPQIYANVVPVKDLRRMSLIFPIPDMTEFYQSGVEGYISHLLGHEGPGSLLSLLKSKNWVNELAVDSEAPARGFGLFTIELELTVSGLKSKNEVILHVFQYLQMMKETGPLQWVWEEIKDVDAMLFRFKDKEDPMSYVSDLTPRMILYPLEHVINAGHILSKFEPQKIKELLEDFTANKIRVIVTTKQNKSKAILTEEFYGIKYFKEEIESHLIEKWKNCEVHEDLKMPIANEFIPTLFECKPRDNTGIIPRMIETTPLSNVWFLQDNEFLLPKASVYIDLFSSLPLLDPLHSALNYMLKVTLEDSLSEFSYAASISGLEYSLTDTAYGLQIWCGGYDHKLNILLKCVLTKLIDYSCNIQRFNELKEAYTRKLNNFEKSQPQTHASWYLTHLLKAKDWTHVQRIEILPDVTFENLQNYAKRFVSRLKLVWLIYGNVDQEEARVLVLNCENMLRNAETIPIPESEFLIACEAKLEPGSDYIYKKEHAFHSDSCATILYQCGLFNTRKTVLMELLCQIISEPCFDELRTKEQLGYTVWSGARKSNSAQGFQIMVQSKHHPELLECRVDAFLERFYETLLSMSETNFLKHRAALKVHKLEKPKKIWDRARRVWEEIVCRQFNFDRQNIELQELETIQKDDVVAYFSELVGTGPPSNVRKRVAIQILSVTEKGAGSKENNISEQKRNKHPRVGIHIQDVVEWKKNNSYFEDLKHAIII